LGEPTSCREKRWLYTKSGTAASRAAGIKAAERAIDKALAPKKNGVWSRQAKA
jgi:hypothetical protein